MKILKKKFIKKKSTIFIITAIVSFCIILSASFAWFTSTDQRINHFATAQITDGSVSLFELFIPPTDWKPGQTVTKQVAVLNSSDSDVLVRVSFEEVLYKLGGGDTQKDTTSPIPAAGAIPVNMGIKSLTPSNGWQTLTDLELTSDTVPAGVEILGKKLPVNNKTEYYFVMYYPTSYMSDLKYLDNSTNIKQDPIAVNQKVTANFSVAEGVLAVDDVRYYYFDGRVETQADWAGENERVGQFPYATGHIDVIHPAADKVKIPDITTSNVGEFYLDPKILINYSTDVSTAIADGKWYYNEADGYFYYMGKLLAGTTSPNLVEAITLDESAGGDYALMDLDLIVIMDAIQNTADAVNSVWKIPISTESGTLFNALNSYCQY